MLFKAGGQTLVVSSNEEQEQKRMYDTRPTIGAKRKRQDESAALYGELFHGTGESEDLLHSGIKEDQHWGIMGGVFLGFFLRSPF